MNTLPPSADETAENSQPMPQGVALLHNPLYNRCLLYTSRCV